MSMRAPTSLSKPDVTAAKPQDRADFLMRVAFGNAVSLAPNLAPLIHEDSALLVSESRTIELNGLLWGSLLPLLDGSKGASEIVRDLRTRFPAPEVLQSLGVLMREGALIIGSDEIAQANPSPACGVEGSVGIDVSCPAGQYLKDALEELGISVRSRSDIVALDLVLVDDYLDLATFEEKPRHRAWMPVKLVGHQAWFGPIFKPSDGACWSCLEHRLLRTREAHALAERSGWQPALGAEGLAAVRICALQIARWISDPEETDHPLRSNLATMDAGNLDLVLHPVTRRPQCPECGSEAHSAPEALDISAKRGDVRHDAGERSAEALLENYAHHVDEITGLVPALELVASDPVHVTRARYIRPVPAETPRRAIDNRRLVAAGKGTTAIAARAGALAEALERYSTTWDGSEPVVVASLEELGDECIHPNASMLFSEQQLRRGSELAGIKFQVPAPFDPAAPVGWLRAWSVTRKQWRYVSAGWALMGYQGPGAEFAVGDSNGNAAGANFADAVLSGVGELIERDGVALWWYNRVRRPGVSLEGIDPAYVERLSRHYREIEREFWLLDLTSDLGVPIFAAVSQQTNGAPTPVIAFGAHLDPRTAVLRALTEMNQMLPHSLARAPREDRSGQMSGRSDSMAIESLDDHPYLLPATDLPQTRLQDFRTPSDASLDDQIDWLSRRIERSGMELIVLDQTRPDVGLPVCRVIVPGLRHFWRRLAPGRLYDVPVQLGWRQQPLNESEMNSLELAI